MADDVHALKPRAVDFDVRQPNARTLDDPTAQALMRELRDMLFVVAGAAEHMAHGSGDRADALLDGVVDAAKRVAERARLLADHMSALPETPAASRCRTSGK